MPHPKASPRIQHHEEVRRRILDAALKLFARQGYADTTTRQIIHEANSSTGNLYHYFPDKEAILRALVDDAAATAERAIDQALAKVEPGPAQPAAAIYIGVTTLLDQADLARIIFIQAPQSVLKVHAIARFRARIRAFLEANPAFTRGDSPSLMAAAYQGALWQVVESALTEEDTPNADQVAALLVRWNLRALGIEEDDVQQALEDVRSYLATLKSATESPER